LRPLALARFLAPVHRHRSYRHPPLPARPYPATLHSRPPARRDRPDSSCRFVRRPRQRRQQSARRGDRRGLRTRQTAFPVPAIRPRYVELTCPTRPFRSTHRGAAPSKRSMPAVRGARRDGRTSTSSLASRRQPPNGAFRPSDQLRAVSQRIETVASCGRAQGCASQTTQSSHFLAKTRS